MEYIITQRRPIPNITLNLKSPAQLSLEYEALDIMNQELMMDAAECLAETFAGIDIAGKQISEPMVKACGLSKKDMFEFVLEYLKSSVDDGLSFVAKDKKTNRVVAVVACENFNPEEEIPRFEGNLAPMNNIIDFLSEIDERFVDTIKLKTGKKVAKNEYVHAFMAGSRLGKFKSYVVAKLVKLIMEKAQIEGYKGIFAEATNIRSAKVLTDYHDFHMIIDKDNKPILKEYSSVEIFKEIPSQIALDCRILYKPLQPQYDI